MRDDDIEILEDFSDNSKPNDIIEDLNQNSNQTNSQPVAPTPTLEPAAPSESVSEFDKMVSEASNIPTTNSNDQGFANPTGPQTNPSPYPSQNPNPYPQSNNQSYDNGFAANDYANDANNNLVQQNEQDLTITAVYPNGFAVDQKDELESTLVIKPKKKSSGDLYLIIIVAVLAITLVALILVFYVL